MAINGLSVFLCFKYAAKKILEQGHGEGRLIAASSLAGKMGENMRFLSVSFWLTLL